MIVLTHHGAVAQVLALGPPFVPMPILKRYADLMAQSPIAWLFVMQRGDTAACLATLRQLPFDEWEFIDRTEGWFEAVFILSDDGFGHVVLIPDQPDSDPDLMTICKANCS